MFTNSSFHAPVQRIVDALQPVFIVGTPKSGTTFLLSLFDSHPSVIPLLELRYRRFMEKVRPAPDSLVAAATEYVCSRRPPVHPLLDRDLFAAEFESALIHDDGERNVPLAMLKSCLAAVVKASSRNEAPTHFVEKTPTGFHWVDEILADFPNAKVIHMLRDPRDNYLALCRLMDDPASGKTEHGGYHPLAFFEDRLLDSMDSAYANVQRFGDRYRILFYTDLIYGGEAMMRRIAEFLELPWHEALVIPSRNGELWQGNSFSPDLKDGLNPFDTRPIGRWKKELDARRVCLLDYTIQAFGLTETYPPKKSRSSWEALLAMIPPFKQELRHEYRRVNSWSSSSSRYLKPFTNLVRLAHAYVSRRIRVFKRLRARLRYADNRLARAALKAHSMVGWSLGSEFYEGMM